MPRKKNRDKLPIIERVRLAIADVRYLMEHDLNDGANYAPLLHRLQDEYERLQRAIV